MRAPIAGKEDLPNFSEGTSILEAQRIPRDLFSDIVVYWSTNTEPYDFIMRCHAVIHAPGFLSRVEIIADQLVITVNDFEQLRDVLHGRRLVRFNVADWSVTWTGATKTRGPEIQAVFGKLPTAMKEMVKQSIAGMGSARVDEFFEALHHSA